MGSSPFSNLTVGFAAIIGFVVEAEGLSVDSSHSEPSANGDERETLR